MNTAYADYMVNFTGATDRDSLNDELKQNFTGFKNYLQKSPYYQKSRNTSLAMDFMVLLTNKSHDPRVCRALDYLLKTGGDFKYHKASQQEKGFLAAASQIVVEHDPSLANEDYHSIIPLTSRSQGLQKHLAKVLEIQRKSVGGDSSHPLRGELVLPEAARDIPDELKKNMNTDEGWMRFKRLLLRPDLFKEGNTSPSDGKASWLNDVELIGFQLGVLPDIRGNYIDNLWSKDNQWMEDKHNYVQWWFLNEMVGQGDKIKAPRFLEPTVNILQSDLLICSYVQQMMRVSFARKARFWGQHVVYAGKDNVTVEKLAGPEGARWEENWIHCSHNYYRMTRVLKSFRFFGLRAERKALFAYLSHINARDARVNESFGLWKGEHSRSDF